jgi:RNA polymerase sigma factor (sigma-70 family)
MSRVINGETEMMGILYERYKISVYSYFFKITCGDREASEDLVQTVFYRAIRYRHSFTGQGSFANWLFRIARNVGLATTGRKTHAFTMRYTHQKMIHRSMKMILRRGKNLRPSDLR